MNYIIKKSYISINKLEKIWEDNKLLLDIPIVDLHHMWLIYLILVLENEINSEETNNKETNFKYISSELINYTINHFAVEEELFKKYKYKETADHHIQHTQFINYIKENSNITELNSPEKIFDLLSFLKDWLYEHIQKEDAKYKIHFQNLDIDINAFIKKIIDNGIISIKTTPKQLVLYERITGKHFEIFDHSKDIINDVMQFWKFYKLGLGIPILDMQHLWLVKITMELEYSSIHSNPTEATEILTNSIKELNHYFAEHFYVEESIMRHLDFSELIEHKRFHKNLEKMINLNNSPDDIMSNPKATLKNLTIDLKIWLASHIGTEDKKFKKIYKPNKEKVNEFIRSRIKVKEFSISAPQLNLYGVIKEILETELDH
jgi:hemerythrin-like metal-binding protein